ncbi:formate C-acetyltransferase [Desulfotomaculum arcticum]|uniref:Formate C-acetyltransferase n=1 Tax=Desulfotruncus arcticus DSM 17038 TaxID=1121424 RepID=A0A1I2YN17_9FIRM|nr:pyruvate formate lyase family protein [Desulfotruncus arcticus]SFH27035.1 formate C-acetyltransferase [Desulfotomaculum arcticum] [Desulfotruncus arcticus DSM 17038]
MSCCCTLSPQEERILNEKLSQAEMQKGRERVCRILNSFKGDVPRISVERARLMTESFKGTEGQPLVLRWAKALKHICENITVYIGDYDIVVGRADGHPGRHGLVYPELDGAFLDVAVDMLLKSKTPYKVSEDDLKAIKEDIVPYWKDKTLHEVFAASMPEETKNIIYNPENNFYQRYIITQTVTIRSSLQWIHDYEKVLQRGFKDLKREALEKLTALDPNNPKDTIEKRPFLEAAVIVCDATVILSRRYAAMAAGMADKETDEQRKKELLDIAAICNYVPENPARTFREAVQSVWMAQIVSRLEQNVGAVVGNGRMDQYFYPYYKKDIEEGRINDEFTLELLESLWLNMAQFLNLKVSPAGAAFTEGYSHWEALTVGGKTKDGRDATNELSYLILRSKREFPLNYPDLAARVHARTPEKFMHEIAATIKEGSGFPKLINDEEVIPLLLSKGAPFADANDYAVSGCSEVRMPNRDTFTSPCAWVNLGAVLEMALNDGKIKSLNNEQIGPQTGDPREFTSFEDLWRAYTTQQEFILKHTFIQQYLADMIRSKYLAAPFASVLHDLCMNDCKDLYSGPIEGGVSLGFYDLLGFGTVIDSLAAIKKLVFEDQKLTMAELIEALDANFEGKEVIRQMLLNAPKYGNNDMYADSIGFNIESHAINFAKQYRTAFGGQLDARYVPVTAHIPLGKIVGATPNGRKAGMPLADGGGPSHGADTKGPSASLQSIANTKCMGEKERAARLVNLKLSPSTVAGDEGTQKLIALMRTFCDLKLWHLQFNVINRDTLLAAQKDPEKYRNLLVRVAGYSAYFVDLSPELQDEIIARTEHSF